MPFNFLNQGQTDDAATRFQPIDTFIDPVSKIRVSNPANLIDTDFEYGLQPTKWETVEIINNTPAFFSKSGDTTIPDITGVTTNAGTREITVNTAFPHNLDVGIPIRVSGTKSLTADGSYIINATPTPTTFTYLSRANQPDTISIFDLYTSIITGEFFQGSQISIADAEGMTTDGVGPNSTITIKTANKHGFGPKTPFYFLNLNSTVSQEFESQNSTSLSFDPTNSASAQNFDGSNTLLQTPVDLSNSATTSQYQNSITSTNPTDQTVTISINQNDSLNWGNLKLGSPLYYDVNIGSGYFQANPKGVVFIKSVDLIDTNNLTATFQVSELPDGDPLPILANMTGFFQIADQAITFAGNNVDPDSQIDITLEEGPSFEFDGSNQGYITGEIAQSNAGTVVGYTGTNITLFTSEGSLDYYEGAMLSYSTDGTAADGLTSGSTYFVTSFSAGASAGLFNMTVAEFPGQADINTAGGSGSQVFQKIGVSVDKDIIHLRNSFLTEKTMVKYTYPTDNLSDRFQTDNPDDMVDYYFIAEAYDEHNYKLNSKPGYKPLEATGGDFVTFTFDSDANRIYRVHTYTTVGSSTFDVTALGDVEAGGDSVEYLVVAGGGGAGGDLSGGGGGGGVVEGTQSGITTGSYSVFVGDGGTGAVYNSGNNSNNGQNSTLSLPTAITAVGGGGGGSQDQPRTGKNGGSGGGGAGGANGGTGTAGQGNNGGFGYSGNNYPAGGGGGAGGAGQTPGGSSSRGGNGGSGVQSNIDGNNYYYAGGGGGGSYRGSNGGGDGGIGGGGGAYADSGSAGAGGGSARNPGSSGGGDRNGGANTGGGAGGQANQSVGSPRFRNTSAKGGSGIVIVRYPFTDELNPEDFSGGYTATGGDTVSDIFVQEANFIYPYRIHTFTTTGANTFQVVDTPTGGGIPTSLDYLVVAGGGGAGGDLSGGGGAGGVIEGSVASLDAGSYSVFVGDGGTGAVYNSGNNSNNGQNSTLGLPTAITAIGGGGGGSQDQPRTGKNGGSGGGGAGGANGGTGTAGQGNNGGFGYSGNNYPAGGGGGAGGAGQTPSSNGARGGNGGPGVQSNIDGNDYYYAGGGGGGSYTGSNGGGDGGIGGGGGAYADSGSAGAGGGSARNPGSSGGGDRNGGANTGGGAGGQANQSVGSPRFRNVSSSGGSGIVIIRYLFGEPIELEQ